jgi:hypothetical protein
VESERNKEQFRYNYLPGPVQRLLREAFGCYAADLFLAFAVLCRRTLAVAAAEAGTAVQAGSALAFDRLFADAAELGEIEAPTRDVLDEVLFGTALEPEIDADQAAVLIEIVKDMFEQRYVRTAKLRRAIKMRRYFAHEAEQAEQSVRAHPVDSTLGSAS